MAKTTCDLLIRNAQVVSMDASRTIYCPGAVAVSGRRIVEVGADGIVSERVQASEVIDADSGIVHPGFIDAHNHIVHTSCRGVFKNVLDANTPVKFADWKADVTDEDEAAATAMACLEMLRGGFTMFIEPGSLFSTSAAARAVERVGIRALFSPLYLWDTRAQFDAIPALESDSLMARALIDYERSVSALDQELHRNREPDALVRGYIFVYGEGTGSPALLEAAKKCADDNQVPMHLHAGYVPMGADIYRSMTGSSQIVDLMELGVLDRNTVLVHANVLSEADEQAVRDSGCQIVWCPAAFLSLGISDASFQMAKRYRDGVSISLAADGAFDSPSSACMLAARFVSQTYADPLPPEALLEMQTTNAAAAAGMDEEIGSIEVGKRADIVIRDSYAAEGYPDNNPVHSLALIMGQGSVRTVFVDGRRVLDEGRATLVEEREVYRQVCDSVRVRAARLSVDAGPAWPVVRD
jgi:cytosine/adenosine deaminase-related metal-dependent hydrolase